MLPARHSDVLWSKIHLAEGRLTAASHRLWNHAKLADLFPSFLIQLHHIVRGGMDLMAVAGARASGLRHDPVAAIAAEYLARHIEEEKDHADWLLRDVRSLGVEEAAVLKATPSDSVVSLLGGQYFWVNHAHPVTVFGYLIVLEGSPPLVEQLDLIQQRTGLPADAFRCLRSHAEDDPEHLADLNRTLDRMPLTPEQSQRIALSAFHTIDAAASVLDELAADQSTSQSYPLTSVPTTYA